MNGLGRIGLEKFDCFVVSGDIVGLPEARIFRSLAER